MQHQLPKSLNALPPLPTPSEMHLWDKAAFSLGISEAVLMENAARDAFDVLCRHRPHLHGKVLWFYMGSGNNGGDAVCMARYAQNAGALPFILHSKPLGHYRGLLAKQIRIATKLEIPFYRLRQPIVKHVSLPQPDIIIDGLLGTGFQGTLRDESRLLIEAINESHAKCFILALDIPSGLDGMTGMPSPVAVRADATATFAAHKPGLMLPHAGVWTGHVHLCPIGFPASLHKELPCSSYLLHEHCLEDISSMPPQSYKNTYGHVFVIGGTTGLEGAAHLASRAALRTGCGLVTAVTGEKNTPLVKNVWPEIMTFGLQGVPNSTWPDCLPAELAKQLGKSTTLVIGPGFGRTLEATHFLKAILKLPSRPPAVIDADALTLIAHDSKLLPLIQDNDILTPHPGEAASLLNTTSPAIQQDRYAALARLCSLQAGTVVLKGAGTLVGQKNRPILIGPYDIPQLAVGGSGDVLAGCIGAILAKAPSKSGYEAAAQGVVLHALAGKICAQRYPNRGNRASDLADALPMAKEFHNSAKVHETKHAFIDTPFP